MSDPVPSSPPKKTKALTEAQWAEAKADFELGKLTTTALAEKYGVARQSISEGMKKRGAIYGCRSKIVEEAAIDAAKSDASKRVAEIQAMRENQRKLIETTQRMTQKAIGDALRDGAPIHEKKADIQTLRHIMAIFAMGRQELWKIYGLDDDKGAGDEIPDFVVSEYTPEDLATIIRQQGGDLTTDQALSELERQVLVDGEGGDPLDALLDDGD